VRYDNYKGIGYDRVNASGKTTKEYEHEDEYEVISDYEKTKESIEIVMKKGLLVRVICDESAPVHRYSHTTFLDNYY
jgi:hypothetical protein